MGGYKTTIEACKAYATSKGGECLSDTYVKKLHWRCSCGYEWIASFPMMKHKSSWCKRCSGSLKKTIDDCRVLARSKGGDCLSLEYKNNKTDMLWVCAQNHQWFARANSITNGQWCPKCNKLPRITMQDCYDLAEKRGGKLLSTEIKNSSTPLLWECAHGHTWKAKYAIMKYNNCWCPHCTGRARHTLNHCHEEAARNGGNCLSTEYRNSNTKILWECDKGHQWKATYNSVRNQKSWCPVCSPSRIAENNISKYGVANPMHVHHIALKTAKAVHTSITKYHWKTKEPITCIASYECAVVDMLNGAQIDYEWQAHTFKLPNNKTYRPDLYLNELDLWVEIKGYMWASGKKKWDWFSQNYPNSVLWDKQALKDMNVIPSRRSRCR